MTKSSSWEAGNGSEMFEKEPCAVLGNSIPTATTNVRVGVLVLRVLLGHLLGLPTFALIVFLFNKSKARTHKTT